MYIGCHTDDLMIVAKDKQSIMDQLTKVYEVAKPGPPSYHLGCNYSLEAVDGRDYWFVSSETHTKEAIAKEKCSIKIHLLRIICLFDDL